MTTTSRTLASIIQEYLSDTHYKEEYDAFSKDHYNKINFFKRTFQNFAKIPINPFSTNSLRSLYEGLKVSFEQQKLGFGYQDFFMDLTKIVLYYPETSRIFTKDLQGIINDLNTQTVAQNTELLYFLLTQDNELFLKNSSRLDRLVPPEHSAFIISLIAFWLDHANAPYVYYPALCFGLAALINAQLVSSSGKLTSTPQHGVLITTASDHLAVTDLLNTLIIDFPQLKNAITDVYWDERFFYWLTAQIEQNPTFLGNDPTLLMDAEKLLERHDQIHTQQPPHLVDTSILLKEDTPLAAVPEPLLSARIEEVRSHILIAEEVIRRIYHALLNGHVILTGPPGTGKTELARLIPEILWRHEEQSEFTAYSTTLVTATSEWSTRTLISSIVPIINNEKISYQTQYGHLTKAILKNWIFTESSSSDWIFHGRTNLTTTSFLPNQMNEQRDAQEFQGHWLIIDEFNRAPIDTALGEALTSLGNNQTLQVAVGNQYIQLPLPKDFRIIGTLNSFDRSYLNQISEALKRRFSFIEVLPPTRSQRKDEQDIVLYKSIKLCKHFKPDEIILAEDVINWQEVVVIGLSIAGTYDSVWDNSEHPFSTIFYNVLWPLLEVIRIYRQLGTAQAIALVRQVLTPGLLQNASTEQQWLTALDNALCDTIVDQLQILLPDELEVLLWYLKLDADHFVAHYNAALAEYKPRRRTAHLEALSAIVDDNDQPYLTDEAVEHLLEQEEPELAFPLLSALFQLDHPPYKLPQFTRRLRNLKAERGL